MVNRILAVTNRTTMPVEDFAYLYNSALADSAKGDFRLMGLDTGSHGRVRSSILAALRRRTVQSVDVATCDEATADAESVLLSCSVSEAEAFLDGEPDVEEMRKTASLRVPSALGNNLHGSSPIVDKDEEGNAVCVRFYVEDDEDFSN